MGASVWVDAMSSRFLPASEQNKGGQQPKYKVVRDRVAVPKRQATTNAAMQKKKDQKIQSARAARRDEKAAVRGFTTTTALARGGSKGNKSASQIPRNGQIKGLKFPKGDKADGIQKRLKKKSPWFQSIVDPLHGADVKIPDATGFETGTLQLVHRNSIVTGTVAAAVDGYRVICPLPNLSGSLPDSMNWQYTIAGSDASNVQWGAILSTNVLPFETSETLRAYSDGVRVVSGSITVQSEASLANNSGMMIGYINPYPDRPFPTGLALTEYANHYKTGLIPINNNKPCTVKYLPVKQNGGMYDMFYEPTNSVGTASATEIVVPYYEMGVLINGAPPGTTFLVTVVFNYEFLPTENAINILAAKPSPVDAQEVDLVENWVQDIDVVSMTSSVSASSAPSSSAITEPGQGTGFGMFAETVMEMLPVLLPLIL